jgi:hypothetical protein
MGIERGESRDLLCLEFQSSSERSFRTENELRPQGRANSTIFTSQFTTRNTRSGGKMEFVFE